MWRTLGWVVALTIGGQEEAPVQEGSERDERAVLCEYTHEAAGSDHALVLIVTAEPGRESSAGESRAFVMVLRGELRASEEEGSRKPEALWTARDIPTHDRPGAPEPLRSAAMGAASDDGERLVVATAKAIGGHLIVHLHELSISEGEDGKLSVTGKEKPIGVIEDRGPSSAGPTKLVSLKVADREVTIVVSRGGAAGEERLRFHLDKRRWQKSSAVD